MASLSQGEGGDSPGSLGQRWGGSASLPRAVAGVRGTLKRSSFLAEILKVMFAF